MGTISQSEPVDGRDSIAAPAAESPPSGARYNRARLFDAYPAVDQSPGEFVLQVRHLLWFAAVLVLITPAAARAQQTGCAPLPPPAGAVINVDPSQGGSLQSILDAAQPGDSIQLLDGVVLDGRYTARDLLLVQASDVTVADLTLTRSYCHLVHVVPEGLPLSARGWRITANVLSGFWCSTGLSEHAIHVWTGSRDTLVDRNVLHNTVVSTSLPRSSSIEWRFANSFAVAANNLVSHSLLERDGARAVLGGNIEWAPLPRDEDSQLW